MYSVISSSKLSFMFIFKFPYCSQDYNLLWLVITSIYLPDQKFFKCLWILPKSKTKQEKYVIECFRV